VLWWSEGSTDESAGGNGAGGDSDAS
jgi:hypothetical protein